MVKARAPPLGAARMYLVSNNYLDEPGAARIVVQRSKIRSKSGSNPNPSH